ncbi:tetratricopeptide repeat protein [bacterium]|nr:tetratricopeptide repeat protein [bacterium]
MGKKAKRRIPAVKKRTHPFQFVSDFIGSSRIAFGRLSLKGIAVAAVLILIGILIRLEFINQTIKYDEAFTFIRFARLPFTKLIGYYPLPNNHILHTILVKASILAFDPWEWAIRLPVFLAGILLLPVMFVLGNKAFGPGSGYWALALSATSSGLAAYSVNARGYMLVCLFTAVVFWAAVNIRGKGGSTKDWTLFVLGSVAGLFTVPVMLFSVAALSAWLLWDVNPALKGGRKTVLLRLAAAGGCILAGTALCYTPLMLDSGLKALIANKYVTPQPMPQVLSQLPEFAKSVIEYFVEVLPLPMQILLGVAFILGLRRAPLLALSLVLTTLLLIIYQRVIPPVRALSSGLVFFLLFSASGMQSIGGWITQRVKLPRGIPLDLILAVAWAVTGSIFLLKQPSLGRQDEHYPEAREVAAYMDPLMNDKSDVVAMPPECEIIAYYLSDRAQKDVNIDSDINNPKEKMLFVANLRHGSVDSIMQSHLFRFLPYNYPQQLTLIDSTAICILESIQATGLKPNSMLEKFISDFKLKKQLSQNDMLDIKAGLNCLHHLNREKTIDSLLTRMLEIDPDNQFALEKLGDLKLQTDQHDQAEQYYRRLLRLSPQNGAGLCGIGVLEGIRGNLESARRYLLAALSQDSTDFNSLYNIGLVCLKANDNREAIAWFNKAAALRPNDHSTILGLGMAYSASPEQRDKALEMYRKAQELNPDQREFIQRRLVEPLLRGEAPTDTDP